MTKISYLVALYNKENYILEAIESILADVSDDYCLEVCIVDDGSSDESLNLVKNHYLGNSSVIIEGFDKNKGKVAAYNRAFDLCSGNYVAILGADDKVLKGRNSAMLKASIKSGKSVYGGLVRHIEKTGLETLQLPCRSIDFNANILSNKYSGGAVLMRIEDCLDVFPIPQELKFEDWWISFHLLRKNSVEVVDIPVTFYRVHGGNDNASEHINYNSMKKDYARHFAYLSLFKPYLNDHQSQLYWSRALSLRRSFFGKKDFFALMKPPFNRSWLVLFLYCFIGPQIILRVYAAIKRYRG